MSKLLLGSSSPRRKDLLKQLGFDFEIVKPETEELHRAGESPAAYVKRNAQEKGHWIIEQGIPAHLGAEFKANKIVVVSADTVVAIDGEILEKPKDKADAKSMLGRLSGRSHTVFSGVFLGSQRVQKLFECATVVSIKPLSEEEITWYVDSGEPMDKAGSYAAQGLGSYMVTSLEGSYANVVGLPISMVVESLSSDFGINLWSHT